MTRAERLSLAIAFAFAATVLGYAVVRVVSAAFFPEPSPAIVVWSERSAFVWRSALALYIGGMGAFGGYALAARSPSAGAQWLSRAVFAAVIAIVLQGTLLP